MRALVGLGAVLALSACGEPIERSAQNEPPASAAPVAPAPAPTPAIAGPAAAPEARTVAEPVLTPEGFGPVRIGMTEAEARQALALGPAAATAPADQNGCHMLSVGQEPSVFYMVQQGRVTRISFTRPGPGRTDKGLGVGSTAEQVRAAYGAAVQAGPHKYVEAPAESLTVWTEPGQRGVRFETDAKGVVTTVHAGDQSIELVEGCS